MDEKYFTPQEIAEKLKVSINTVRKWYASGKLESTKAGRMVRISEQQLDRFLKQRNSPKK
jgi:excisionase family DNA binding protein